jgi:hypothetical protein
MKVVIYEVTSLRSQVTKNFDAHLNKIALAIALTFICKGGQW